jgi:hypothetical protein
VHARCFVACIAVTHTCCSTRMQVVPTTFVALAADGSPAGSVSSSLSHHDQTSALTTPRMQPRQPFSLCDAHVRTHSIVLSSVCVQACCCEQHVARCLPYNAVSSITEDSMCSTRQHLDEVLTDAILGAFVCFIGTSHCIQDCGRSGRLWRRATGHDSLDRDAVG